MEEEKKQAESRPVYEFAGYTLDTGRGLLIRADREVDLRPQTLSVLQYLVERAGLLVTRREILGAVWPGTEVTDDSLTQCIAEIRRAIDDSERTLIKTVPKRGFIFDMPVRTGGGADRQPQHETRRTLLVVAAITAVTIAFGLVWMNRGTHKDSPPSLGEYAQISIAVLPLDDMSQEQDMQYFGDGVAEEILNQLTRYPDLRVIARTSSFALKDKGDNIAEIRRQLDVDYVLEGSVRRSGDETRITVQLIDTHTHGHLWSKTFDHELIAENLISVQDEIAEQVAQTIGVSMGSQNASGASMPLPENPAVVEHYLKGKYYQHQIETGASQDFAAAIARFEATIDADPSWAPGYAALGRALHFKASYGGWDEGDEHLYEESRRHLERAIELNPDYAPAYDSLAFVVRQHKMDFMESKRLYQRSFALGGQRHWGYAILMGSIGRESEAIDHYKLALLTNPLSTPLKTQYAWSLSCAGRFDESLVQWTELQDRHGPSMSISVGSVYALLKKGRKEEARKLFEGFVDSDDNRIRNGAILAMLGLADEAKAVLDELDAAPFFRPLPYVVTALALGQRERALAYVEKAAADDPHWLMSLLCETGSGELWDEPRFRTVFREAGFPGW